MKQSSGQHARQTATAMASDAAIRELAAKRAYEYAARQAHLPCLPGAGCPTCTATEQTIGRTWQVLDALNSGPSDDVGVVETIARRYLSIWYLAASVTATAAGTSALSLPFDPARLPGGALDD